MAIRKPTVTTLRNMDGSPELLESGFAHFYTGILSVNSNQRQRG
jgi:hypothetical protein